jgi:type II secretory pathway pseudopilin PulG
MRLPMHVWLAASHLAAVAVALIAILATGVFASDLTAQTSQDAEHQAVIAASLTASLLEAARRADPDAPLAAISTPLSARLSAIKTKT